MYITTEQAWLSEQAIENERERVKLLRAELKEARAEIKRIDAIAGDNSNKLDRALTALREAHVCIDKLKSLLHDILTYCERQGLPFPGDLRATKEILAPRQGSSKTGKR